MAGAAWITRSPGRELLLFICVSKSGFRLVILHATGFAYRWPTPENLSEQLTRKGRLREPFVSMLNLTDVLKRVVVREEAP